MSERKSLRSYLDDFLVYKRQLGYVYQTAGYYLKHYTDYVERNSEKGFPDKKTTEQYLAELSIHPGTHYGTASAVREFCRYLIHQGQDVNVPSHKISHQPAPEPPYFFTDNEIIRFFAAADSFAPNPNYPGREIIIPALFRVMYCCGTRCIEARMLLCSEVSLQGGYIDILKSKGHKNRRLYISEELCRYLEEYNRRIGSIYPGRKYFFPGVGKQPYLGKGFVSGNFRRCWDNAFPDFNRDLYPRAYDFRHHFAWANINRWASEGLDVNAMLPYLMKYMGHSSVNQTLYYFHFVPDFYPTYRKMITGSEDIIPEVPL